jgi:hypothetical protein
MKQYVVDELSPKARDRLQAYLEDHFGRAGIQGVYWIPIDPSLYSREQAAHAGCQPFYFVVELNPASLAAELLVRTKSRIRCDCMAYASKDQVVWLIRLIDSIFERLMISA